jgi:hypothetical protein
MVTDVDEVGFGPAAELIDERQHHLSGVAIEAVAGLVKNE